MVRAVLDEMVVVVMVVATPAPAPPGGGGREGGITGGRLARPGEEEGRSGLRADYSSWHPVLSSASPRGYSSTWLTGTFTVSPWRVAAEGGHGRWAMAAAV